MTEREETEGSLREAVAASQHDLIDDLPADWVDQMEAALYDMGVRDAYELTDSDWDAAARHCGILAE